jgi:hypothetical protein
MYTLTSEGHTKLLRDNVTKTYKKAPTLLDSAINSEAASIGKFYNIEKRAECLAKVPAFITLKDHKEHFHAKIPCRSINPCKSELGNVSKKLLDHINSEIRLHLKANQWKNPDDVINWFESSENKSSCSFIQMDINEFYPSITKTILDSAINFAKGITTINDLRTIYHCRSLLYFDNEPWKK